MRVSEVITSVLGDDLPLRVTAFDGSTAGPVDAATALHIVRPEAVHRIITARGQELGFARAIIAGDIEVRGDVFGLFEATERLRAPRLDRSMLAPLASLLGIERWTDVARLRPLPPPPEEIRLGGRLHSRSRDAAAISSHYDVSNAFYDLVLGPSMTYSCAVFEQPQDTLFTAQRNKHELICRKLGLRPGMRLLDIGSGWGSMVLHAARHHGVQAVGVTISNEQAVRARKRVAETGLTDQVEIRIQDYRDVNDGPFDAISSVGMSEHVGGPKELATYFAKVRSILAPNGRFLNHAIARSAGFAPAGANGFIQRYVFPDGELHELGATISTLQDAGFEALHAETFRLHYARTLRRWVDNLEASWDAAVAEVGRGRALVWWLYMAGSAVAFERGDVQLHQILAAPDTADRRAFALRPDW